MGVEHPRHRRRAAPPAARLPRRATDRVEDAVAWLLVCLALLTTVVAVVVGVARENAGTQRARTEARERTPVRVVLLERADIMPAADGVSSPTPVDVPARWILPDGTEHVGPVATAVRNDAGAVLTKWVDRAGRPVPAPVTGATVVLEAVLAGVAVALAGWLALALVWWAVRRCTAACNAARWARQWRVVEPGWSGRLPGE